MVHERIKSADVLVAVDAAALRLGLRPGLGLADARARLPRLYAASAAPDADAALLDRIAADCDRYTPLVGRDAPDGVTLDITGAAHLRGGERPLLDAVASRLAAAGLAAHIAIAGAPDTARALARHGPARDGIVVPEGSDATAAMPLPVAALRLPPETITGLVRAGLKTIGCLARRPRAPLAARFGAILVDRLERTLGQTRSPISPWRPEPVAHADLACGEPIVRPEDIDAALAHLAALIATELHTREQGARLIEASFFRVDGHVRRLEVAMARPSRDAAAITRLLAERLAALAAPLDPGFGLDHIRLAARHAEPLPAVQADLGRARDADDGLTELIDRLSARFGPAHVARFLAGDSHIPERSARLRPATARRPADAPEWPTPEPGEPPSAPVSLFEPPQPIEAMAPLPDGPPLRFRWRRVVHDVVRAEGPERIAPEWWRLDAPPAATTPPLVAIRQKQPRELLPSKRPREGRSQATARGERGEGEPVAPSGPQPADDDARPPTDWLREVRDYYRVEDRCGRRYWVFRAGLWQPGAEPPRWFLHGLFA